MKRKSSPNTAPAGSGGGFGGVKSSTLKNFDFTPGVSWSAPSEAGSKLAALREQQKTLESEEQSSLNNGKAMANDAKVSQILHETKNKLAQESTRRAT